MAKTLGPKDIVVTDSRPGYAHCTRSGICGDEVTTDEIKKKIYHPYFGGREARIWGENPRKWSAVEHTD